jgi:hypothetical protein
MISFFNNLNDTQIELLFLELKEMGIYSLFHFLVFFANTTQYLIFALKVYRTLCFSKITFDSLPTINPYIWPFSIFRVLTQPYFRFWSKIFPTIRSGKSSFDVSLIFGLEALSTLTYFLTQLRILSLQEASKLLDILNINVS